MRPIRCMTASAFAAAAAVLLAVPVAADGVKWVSHAAPPDVLLAPTVVPLTNGSVLIAGGQRSAGINTATTAEAEIYNVQADQWTITSPMPVARLFGTGIGLSNGGVLIFGGSVADGPNSAVVYGPAVGNWFSAGPLPAQVGTGSAVIQLGDGNVLVAGGQNLQRDPLAASETFDPIARRWTATPCMTVARWRPGAVALTSGKVLVVGGLGPQGPLSSAEVFDPVGRRWAAAGSMTDARWAPAVARLADGRVLVAGGEAIGPVGSAEIYDPATNAWTSAGNMAFGGVSQAVYVSANQIVVTTYLESSDRTLHVSIFDAEHGQWTEGPNLLLTHYLQTTVAESGEALVVGGSTVASLEITAIAPNPGNAAVAVANSSTTTWVLALFGIVLLALIAAVLARSRWAMWRANRVQHPGS